jgi:methionyl-tRNA formyltransferase
MKKIVLCGIQEQGKDLIKFLYKNNIKVTHIVTISEDVAIKNKSDSTWVSYEDIAKELNIEIYYAYSYSFKSKEDILYFKKNEFDVLLLGGWQRLITEEILNTIKYPIGQHGSPEFLPKGRGRSPLNWAIIQGKKRLIWNLFLLNPGVDEGAVLDYQIFEIQDQDTCQTLYYKVSVAVKHMLIRVLPKLLNDEVVLSEQKGKPSYFLKRTPEDGQINWNDSVYTINNLIRAITNPYPGAFTVYNGNQIMIWSAQIWDTMLDFYKDREYGEIVEVFGTDYVVKCYDGLLLITDHEDKNVFETKIYGDK